MSRSKETIYTSVHNLTMTRTLGSSTDQPRVILPMIVHAGPKPTIGREVELVMDYSETLRVAIALIGMLPPDVLNDQLSEKQLGRLKGYIRIAETK